jgi:hypothetical protein
MHACIAFELIVLDGVDLPLRPIKVARKTGQLEQEDTCFLVGRVAFHFLDLSAEGLLQVACPEQLRRIHEMVSGAEGLLLQAAPMGREADGSPRRHTARCDHLVQEQEVDMDDAKARRKCWQGLIGGFSRAAGTAA